jgi:uronate dehydrogenase
MHTILLTGGNGNVGRCVAEGLRKAGYDVRSTSRTRNAELGVTRLDVRDAQACVEAMRGVDTVIHLGYYMLCDQFLEEQIPTNIAGVWNIYAAAAKNGVRRVIFGSSNHAEGFNRRDAPTEKRDLYRPDSPYGLTKCFAELCGRYFSDRCGISVLNVRIGTFSRDGLPYSRRRCRTWLSPGDCQLLFQKCVEADANIPFLTVYGMSNNEGCDFDIGGLKSAIGCVPQDNGADHLEHALKTDLFFGMDDIGFLGAESVLFDPWGALAPEAAPELCRRHGVQGAPDAEKIAEWKARLASLFQQKA